MNCKNLMIGDWVYVDRNFTQKYHKVRSLSIEGGIGGTYVNDYGVECPSLLVRDAVKPIPLTEEILIANGFRFTDLNSIGLRYQYYGVKSLQVVVEKYEEEDAFGHYQRKIVTLDNECIYVHELQHALRLCGLNELADNFKVE